MLSSPVICEIFSADRSLNVCAVLESPLLTCVFESFNNLSPSSSSSFCPVLDPYLQLSLYNDDELELAAPKRADVGFVEFKLKKFIPFIMLDEPTELENVEADNAA